LFSLHLFYGYALCNLAIQATETNKCDFVLFFFPWPLSLSGSTNLQVTHFKPVALFVGPSSTGEKSSNLHHILVTAYHCMPSINGSTIGHRWWAVHTTIEAKMRRKGFSHIGTKSLELSTPRHQTGSLQKQL